MHTKWVFKHFRSRSRKGFFPITMLWTVSLLVGFLLCICSSFEPISVLRSVLSAERGLLGSLFTCLVPIAVVAIALLSQLFPLSYLVVFLCGVSYGYCGCLIYLAAGVASWLLQSLLLFSAGCSSVLMWWLMLHSKTADLLHKNICIAGVLACVLFLIDLFIVSPIVDELAKYF